MKLTSALAERADLLGVACWRSAMGRQEAPRRSQLIAGVRRTPKPAWLGGGPMRKAVLLAVVLATSAGEAAARERMWAILPERAAAETQRLCSRAGPPAFEGTWVVTAADVREAELRLPDVSRLSGDGAVEGIGKPREYYRQYIGLVIDGRRWIYLNAFAASRRVPGWRSRLANLCDGGVASWGVLYDPASHRFSQLRANGS